MAPKLRLRTWTGAAVRPGDEGSDTPPLATCTPIARHRAHQRRPSEAASNKELFLLLLLLPYSFDTIQSNINACPTRQTARKSEASAFSTLRVPALSRISQKNRRPSSFLGPSKFTRSLLLDSSGGEAKPKVPVTKLRRPPSSRVSAWGS